MENKYYVYAYLDPRKPGKYKYKNYTFDYEPFYIGKGSSDRYKHHLRETNDNYTNESKFNRIQKIRKEYKDDPIVKIVKDDLPEKLAFKYEEELIRIIGRKSENGPLTNIIPGGGEPSIHLGKTVYQYDSNINLINEYNSIKDAARFLSKCNIKIKKYETGIGKVCRCEGMRVISFGYHWSYTLYESEDEIELVKDKMREGKIRKRATPVYQYDLNGNIIQKYDSMREASKKTGIHRYYINRCCIGKIKHINNFKFKFKP